MAYSSITTLLLSLLLISNATASTRISVKKGASVKPALQQQQDVELVNDEGIPAVQHWPHRPVFLKASRGTQVSEGGKALPLGVPFAFETDIFKGQALVRLRNAKSDDSEKCRKYFQGKKRLVQFVVQGRFKKPVNMADVYVGTAFQEPMSMVPPPFIMKLLRSFFDRIAPGTILDLSSQAPKILTLFAGKAQTISISEPGSEPDITSANLPEDMGRRFAGLYKSIKERKRSLLAPKNAAQYDFDTQSVYTLELHDDAMDYGTYNMKLPGFGNFDLGKVLGPQPLGFSAVTKSGETIYNFDVWHENVYQMRFNK